MERIAFVYGETVVCWSSLVLTLAAVTAALFFLSLYVGRCGNAVAGFAAVPLGMALSLVCARFFHWYCRADSYDGFLAAITDYSQGGYALMGAFLGRFLAAAFLRLLRFHRNLPMMLDGMAVAGCAGVAVGRLASFFNASDRGQVVEDLRSLPWVWPVTNAVSGATEYRLATFLLQAMAALALFIILALYYRRTAEKRAYRDGDVCLMMLMIYGASQVVLDSTRYDSLFFRSNGFVSVVQVLGALGLGLAIAVFSRRVVRTRGFRLWCVPIWLAQGACVGGAGYMEYYVQRRGNEAAFAYSVMAACLAGAVGLALLLRALAAPKQEGTL